MRSPDRRDPQIPMRASMRHLLLASFLVGPFLLCSLSEARERVEPPPSIARLVEELSSVPRGYEAVRVGDLLHKHDVKEEDVLAFLLSLGDDRKYDEDRVLWWVVLTVGSRHSIEVAVDRAFRALDGEGDLTVAGAVMEGGGSEELSRVLCVKVKSQMEAREDWATSETIGLAVKTISRHPVAEAVPLLRSYVLGGGRKGAREAIDALGRANTPGALDALEVVWIKIRADGMLPRGERSLPTAIAEYGDRGVEVLARIAEGDENHESVFYGLALIGTPAAVQLAEKLCDPMDPDSRAGLLRVKAGAGEPYRTPALLDALEKDDAPRVRWTALELCTSVEEPSAELREVVRRLALAGGHGSVRSSDSCLDVWGRRERREAKQTAWSEPVNGLACRLDGIPHETNEDGDTLVCTVQMKNVSGEPLLVAYDDSSWVLSLPHSRIPITRDRLRDHLTDNAPWSGPPSDAGTGRRALPPGEVWTRAFRISLDDVPPREHEPLPMRILFHADDSHYSDLGSYEGLGLRQWTGDLSTPEFVAAIGFPLVEEDLEHWRRILTEGRDAGKLPDGASIEWEMRYQGHGADWVQWFVIRSGRIDASGGFQALPDDLLTIQPQEMKALCELLLYVDTFATTIDLNDGSMGGYSYSEFKMSDGTRRQIYMIGHRFRHPLEKALYGFMEQLLEPRLEEARERLRAPADPPSSPE
jgi:hypothetical protein